MDYEEVEFRIPSDSEDVKDLLSALLGEVGYESFESYEGGLKAYCPTQTYQDKEVSRIVTEFPMETTLTFEHRTLKTRDWNQEWEEQSFTPIRVGRACIIHSPRDTEAGVYPYDIVLAPRLAFGSGHHETTQSMLAFILETEMEGKRVLDMGSGTGVLGILAAKRGAESVVSIDIDDWATENTKENALMNHVRLEVLTGDASLLEGRQFDVIMANINRNILLRDMPSYEASLSMGGILLISGFLQGDIPLLEEKATAMGLRETGRKEKGGWVAMKMEKKGSRHE